FGFKMDVVPGRDNAFQANLNEGTAGEYVGRCAELCGVDHTRMLFNVEVLPQDEYDAWAAEQEANAADEAAAEGAGAETDDAEGTGADGTDAEGSGAESAEFEENDE